MSGFFGAGIFEDAAQQLACPPPLLALEPEENSRLVREVLVERPDAGACPFGYPDWSIDDLTGFVKGAYPE